MVNLFAIRATNPKDMLTHNNPIGIDNDTWLQSLAMKAGVIVCAWGANGNHLNRNEEVKGLISEHKLMCLGTTQKGMPRHPLYIKSDKPLEAYY